MNTNDTKQAFIDAIKEDYTLEEIEDISNNGIQCLGECGDGLKDYPQAVAQINLEFCQGCYGDHIQIPEQYCGSIDEINAFLVAGAYELAAREILSEQEEAEADNDR